MFNFRRKNNSKTDKELPSQQDGSEAESEKPESDLPQAQAEQPGKSPSNAADPAAGEQAPAAPLDQKLNKSRGHFGSRIKALFRINRKLDDDLFEELETLLLTADVGAQTSLQIIENLSQGVKRKELNDADAVLQALRRELHGILSPVDKSLVIDSTKRPYVVLVVGVNGVGKTTTIGKMARRYMESGFKVMLAAGDTFRAAAVEQLQRWGERNDVPVIAQATGADSASVVFDALQAARARDVDLLIADTAGRLHTQSNLMAELQKVKRVLSKLDPEAPHEVMLVIDGGTGQNAISQAREFHQAVELTGLTITKLDGTAKGGVLFGLSNELKIPVRFIGVGESADDLREFDASEFVEALLPDSLAED